MAPVRLAFVVLSAAVAAARHPATKVGLKVVPKLLDAEFRRGFAEGSKAAAYRAGAAARRIVPKRFRPEA